MTARQRKVHPQEQTRLGRTAVRIFAANERMNQMLSFVDSELAGGPWFAGAEFTAADVMMVFPFTTLRNFLAYDLAPYANLLAYLKRIAARPAYQKAMFLAASSATGTSRCRRADSRSRRREHPRSGYSWVRSTAFCGSSSR